MDTISGERRPRPSLSDLDVLLVEPPIQSRQIIRSAFTSLGIRHVREIDHAIPDRSALDLSEFDLILIDANEAASDVLGFITDIRNRRASRNPFSTIVVTTFQPTRALITQAFAVGADDVLVKPLSVRQLQDRLAALGDQRRQFAVTPTYVGPDRRGGTRTTGGLPLIDVPNMLRFKAIAAPQRPDIELIIEQTWRTICRQRAIRCGHAAALWIQLVCADGRSCDMRFLNELRRVPGVLADLTENILDARERAHVHGQVDMIREPLLDPDFSEPRLRRILPVLLQNLLPLIAELQGAVDAETLRSELTRAADAYRVRYEERTKANATVF